MTMPAPIVIHCGIFGVRILRPSTVTVWLGPTLERTFTISEGTGPMNIGLGDNQYTTIHLQGLDAAKQVGSFTKPPAWAVDDPTVLLATPSADGTTCRIEAASPIKLGAAVLTVTDSDDPTVSPLVFNVAISGEAVTSLGATIDPPTEKS